MNNITEIAKELNRLLNEGIEVHPNSPIHEKLKKSLQNPSKIICKNCGDFYGININHKCYKCLGEIFYPLSESG